MNIYVRAIIDQGPPYFHNLEPLSMLLECFHNKTPRKEILTLLKTSDQGYYKFRKQLLDRGFINSDNEILIPLVEDTPRVPFTLPIVFHQGTVLPTELTCLLYRAVHDKEVEDVPSYEIIAAFRKKYSGSNNEAFKQLLYKASDAIAVSAVLSNTTETFLLMPNFIPVPMNTNGVRLNTNGIRGWINNPD